MMKEYYKHPRLYLKAALQENAVLQLEDGQVHYLRNVLRKKVGDHVRVFNGLDGEWLCRLDSLDKAKGLVSAQLCLRTQNPTYKRVHLYFAPLRKQRLDILIEKAVELGASEFHPIITHRTENRNLNIPRLQAQIFEAAEQCERLEIPILHKPLDLFSFITKGSDFPFYIALEREAAKPLGAYELQDELGFLIGPEGGFDDQEIQQILSSKGLPVTLGESVLRAETAAIVCLTYAAILSRGG